jgi:methylglutaconyl-CoA hydratase
MITFEILNQAAVITLNRPEKRNALHPELINNIKDILIENESNESVKSVIITGAGEVFCAGADISYLNELSNYSTIDNEKDSNSLAEFFLLLHNYPKPTIAAVNGAAIAGGCGLASVCDFVFADNEKSKFGYTEVKIGFIPAIVSIFLIRKIGEGFAKQLLMSGELINSKRAYEIGLVDYLSDNVVNDALSFSAKLKSASQQSLTFTKRMINNISTLNIEEAVEYCIKLNTISRSSRDFKEGLLKFLNKNNRG